MKDIPRVLGRCGGQMPGPTLLILGGIHGNEPAGVLAIQRVIKRMKADPVTLRGELVCLSGNLEALASGHRFLGEDLNRSWSTEKVAQLDAMSASEVVLPEDQQMVEILAEVRKVLREATGEVYFLDLHTCSADGTPFLTLGDTLRNRHFAMGIPLPVVLGLEEQVDGSLLEFLNNQGVITLGAEGGQHDAESSVDHLEAVVWFAMAAAGMAELNEIPGIEGYRETLRQASAGVPRVVAVRHRHPTTDDDGFVMEPGFSNIHPVRRGQLLARDSKEPLFATEDGLVLLPRYQGQGNDGYFLARAVSAQWLKVSALLRRLHIGSLAPFLPGIRKHPVRPGTLIVDTRVAFLYPMDVFHLLGYRKVRREGPKILVTRRVFDLSRTKHATV